MGVTIEQKYLTKGHTQMECDNIHAVIERKIRKKSIYFPSDYTRLYQKARLNAYETLNVDHTFFVSYNKNVPYHSIRPGRKVGDPTVNNIEVLKYLAEGIVKYKIYFENDYTDLPYRLNLFRSYLQVSYL